VRGSDGTIAPAVTHPSPSFDRVLEVPLTQWNEPVAAPMLARAVSALEDGCVLYFPQLAFALTADEKRFLAERWHDGKAKNMSYDVKSGQVGGTSAQGQDRVALTAMMERFARGAGELCSTLFASYSPPPVVMRTSYRAMPVDDRETSWRKDDRRLHVDAFPSRPNHGARILRVFSNVNPDGEPRLWRIGEPFADVAARFFTQLPPFRPALARALAAIRVTKDVRSAYDHYMLHLHDAMKADPAYQTESRQQEMPFPPGSTWVCFSDQVSHAAMRGQYMLEQTLEVSLEALQHPERSPLRVLERLAARALA
jgi:hypothetical protein